MINDGTTGVPGELTHRQIIRADNHKPASNTHQRVGLVKALAKFMGSLSVEIPPQITCETLETNGETLEVHQLTICPWVLPALVSLTIRFVSAMNRLLSSVNLP